jgi:hypothetical protein
MSVRRWALLVVVAGCASAAPAGHRYPVPPELGLLIVDDARFAELSRQLRADIEQDLSRHNLEREAKQDRLFVLALLDALAGRWPESLARIDEIAALEPDPGKKAMTGLTIRVWADARTHWGAGPDEFRAALERRLATLPIPLVRGQLAMLRAMGQVFTPEVCRQLVNHELGPKVAAGTITFEVAQAVAFQRYAAVHLAPVGKVIDEVLGAHGIDLPTQ